MFRKILSLLLLFIVSLYTFPTPYLNAQSEAVTAKTIKVIQGNLVKDKPDFPSFYIWRRVYQHKGKSIFKPNLVKSDGTYFQDQSLPDYTSQFDPRFEKRHDLISLENEIASATAESPVLISSTDGRWSVCFDGSPEIGIRYKNNSINKIIKLAGTESSLFDWEFLGWANYHDLFFLSLPGGTTDIRADNFYQYNPEAKSMIHIGTGQEFIISDEGNWIVWVDGGPLAFGDRQIHVYDIKKNTDYVITSGHSDNSFLKWVVETDHIAVGKKLYLKHQYINAISEYKKALDDKKQDAETYGLIGYSYYRNGQLDDAKIALQQSLYINPNLIMSHYNLAIVYWAQSQNTKAIEEIRQIYLLDPTYKKQIYDDTQFKNIINTPEYKEMEKKWNP